MRRGLILMLAGAALAIGGIAVSTPPPARALSVSSVACKVAGLFSGLAGTLCSAASDGVGLVKDAGATRKVVAGAGVAVVIAGIVAWVTSGGHAVLAATARVIGDTTRPQLESSWFSASYWQMAGIAFLLTLPFLFAACVQAVLRSDPALAGRAALGYLPLAVLGICIAAPVVTLLLSASDGMSDLIGHAAGNGPGAAIGRLTAATGAVTSFGSSFVLFFVALLTIAAAITLWLELLIRAAAVDVIVLMLPVFFAALVWPARRMWAIRAVELLIALILAKFVIVAVLSLGAAAVGHGGLDPAAHLAGLALILLAAFSPWALLRLLPLHELAAGVEGLHTRALGPVQSASQGAEGLAHRVDAAAARADAPDDDPHHAATDVHRRLNDHGDRDPAAAVETGPAAAPADDATVAAHADPTPPVNGLNPFEVIPGLKPEGPDGADAEGQGGAEGQGAAPPRIPGMDPQWQRPNFSWKPVILGPESPDPEPLEPAGDAADPAPVTLPPPEPQPDPPLPPPEPPAMPAPEPGEPTGEHA